MLIGTTLRCDMKHECGEEVTHIDEKGFVYCGDHGYSRKFSHRVRRLTKAEIKTLSSGGAIYYERERNTTAGQLKEKTRLLQSIAEALGTGETNYALVEVARNAHRAEMELAALKREEEA